MKLSQIRSRILTAFSYPKTRQIITLFSVNLLTIPIGLLISIVLTRYLGPSDYGNYQFLDDVFNFVVVVFSFGFLYAANRAIVLSNDVQKTKEYYGAALVIVLGLYSFISIILLAYSFFDVNLKHKHLNILVLQSIPFGWIYLITSYFEILFQADNRINLLAISRLLPKIGLLIGVVVINYFLVNIPENRVIIAWGTYLLFQIISGLFVLYKLDVSFRNIRQNVSEIWKFNKTYGFHVYTGNAFSVGIAYFTGVLISYFGSDNSGVGFFTLAFSLSSPMQFIPNTIATTNFKEFASHKSIPQKLTQATLTLSLLSLVTLWIIVPVFVTHFYGGKFKPVIYLNFIISIAATFYGMADYYNKFLSAHGKGSFLRNNALIVGGIVLIFNVIMIPLFGAKGAAITRLIGGAAYLICTYYFYKKCIKHNY